MSPFQARKGILVQRLNQQGLFGSSLSGKAQIAGVSAALVTLALLGLFAFGGSAQAASEALTTNQPSLAGTRPEAASAREASGTAPAY